MKIVILGAGRIGSSLARNLSNSNYEVCIVDEDKNKLSELEDKLDIMTVEGSASHLNTLKLKTRPEHYVFSWFPGYVRGVLGVGRGRGRSQHARATFLNPGEQNQISMFCTYVISS